MGHPYARAGPRGSGAICVNGAAAHLIGAGEQVIIMGFELVGAPLTPAVVLVDAANRVIGPMLETVP